MPPGTAVDGCNQHRCFCPISLCWVVDREAPLALPPADPARGSCHQLGMGQAAAIPAQSRSGWGLLRAGGRCRPSQLACWWWMESRLPPLGHSVPDSLRSGAQARRRGGAEPGLLAPRSPSGPPHCGAGQYGGGARPPAHQMLISPAAGRAACPVERARGRKRAHPGEGCLPPRLLPCPHIGPQPSPRLVWDPATPCSGSAALPSGWPGPLCPTRSLAPGTATLGSCPGGGLEGANSDSLIK